MADVDRYISAQDRATAFVLAEQLAERIAAARAAGIHPMRHAEARALIDRMDALLRPVVAAVQDAPIDDLRAVAAALPEGYHRSTLESLIAKEPKPPPGGISIGRRLGF